MINANKKCYDFVLHNFVIVFNLLLGEYLEEVFLLDCHAILLFDDLQQDLLDFWFLKYALGCEPISCPSEDLGLYVFASLALREKEEKEEVREDLHS